MTVPGSGGVFSAPNGVSDLLAVLPPPALPQAALLQLLSPLASHPSSFDFFLPLWDL